jgi:tetratricopeptide (TPR) repeat protein
MIGGLPAKQQWLERLRTLQELQLRLDALDNARDSRSVSESVPLLLALGRSREAVARLQSLDSRTPTSHLLEAIGFSDLQDWQSLLVACHRSQGLLDQFQPDEKQRWFELRSEALTRLRRTAEALECLREAAIECPTAAPMFSMQAALQCAELGDVPAALEELRSIRVQHPDMAIAIDRQVRRLQTQSCTLPPAWRFGAPNTSAR